MKRWCYVGICPMGHMWMNKATCRIVISGENGPDAEQYLYPARRKRRAKKDRDGDRGLS